MVVNEGGRQSLSRRMRRSAESLGQENNVLLCASVPLWFARVAWEEGKLVTVPNLRWAGLAAAVLLLAGCGFRPLYAERGDGSSTRLQLESIVIGPIPSRLGQILRNDLMDRLTPGGRPDVPRYRLDVELARFKEGLAIRKDEEITRSNLRLTATFTLNDLADGGTAFQGRSRSAASFNLVRSDFANLAAEQDAERRAAVEIGDQIMTRLSIFFSRPREG